MTRRDPLPEIAAAAHQAIVFRQHFPPRHERSALSCFGGAPVAPRDFRWPRPERGDDPKPFAFLMQIDCGAIPEAARLDLLPDRGVLFFFHDSAWTQSEAFRVIYRDGDEAHWEPVPPPDDLEPAYGKHCASAWKWPQASADCPLLLPRWTFDPVAITFARDADDQEEEGAPLLWSGATGVAEALRAAQGEDIVEDPFSVKNLIEAGGVRRPFAGYPHDWRAVQMCAGLVLNRIRHRVAGMAGLRHLTDDERTSLIERIGDEARAWYDRAASHSPFAAVPAPERDQFWSWLADKPTFVHFVLIDALTASIEASLAASPDAAARVPADAARRVHGRHALVVRYDDRLIARPANRMLAPPVDVQGHQWDRAKTHLLLLELSASEGLGHHFGEGVYQFWITPDDLKARRFDKVELTADAY